MSFVVLLVVVDEGREWEQKEIHTANRMLT